MKRDKQKRSDTTRWLLRWNVFVLQLTTGQKLERVHCMHVHFIWNPHIIYLCDYKRAQAYHLQPGWCHCYGRELSSLNHPLRNAYPPDSYEYTFPEGEISETMLLLYCCTHTMKTRTKFVCHPLKSRCHKLS
jgi:hypothetical protein